MPWQYKERNRNRFDLVIPMSSWRANNLGYCSYSFHPYIPSGKYKSPWAPRTQRIVMINSAKFSASSKSNYGLRRKASKNLYQAGVGYSLYGSNWKMPLKQEIIKRAVALKNSLIAREGISWGELLSELSYKYPEYRGHVEVKESVLEDAELSLVIENESDWITEKLFDSICCGAVPIFVGPDLSDQFPLLENCVVRVNASAKNILEKVLTLTAQELEEKRLAIKHFLSLKGDEGIEFWRPENLWKRAANIVRDTLLNNFNR
jgi:hypothetical protein